VRQGKEKFEPEALHEQEFYLCRNSTVFWFTDYMRRLRSRVITMLPWNWRYYLARVASGSAAYLNLLVAHQFADGSEFESAACAAARD
jgi:hypothetical protein